MKLSQPMDFIRKYHYEKKEIPESRPKIGNFQTCIVPMIYSMKLFIPSGVTFSKLVHLPNYGDEIAKAQ
jgi:hypothetical protein